MSVHHRQIGEVADRTGLSLRTIRYYEEQGLVAPATRSHGGFRLYSETDIARLLLVRQMKPLDFTLDEVRDVLGVLDALEAGTSDASEHAALIDRLAAYDAVAAQRRLALREQLDAADEFAASLRRELREQRRTLAPRG